MRTMSLNAELAQGGRRLENEKCLLEVMSFEVPAKCRGSYKNVELEAKNSEFYEIRQKSYVRANGTASRLVLEDLREEAGMWV